MQDKIDLIYIASIGRSGTTLFESMLGAHSEIDTSGEIHLWPHEITGGGILPTGSGQFVQDSSFWQKMERCVEPLRQLSPQVHYFREEHDAGRTLRLDRLSDFRPRPLSPAVARHVEQYGRNNYELFSVFLDLIEEDTGRRPRWVVDASKDAYRLLWLLRSGFFNIQVFHLVKDPRAFIFSVTKEWIQRGGATGNAKRVYFAVRQSLAWVIRNHLYSLIARHHLADNDYMLIQYEQLASEPKLIFKRACEQIGCAYEPEAVDRFRAGSRYAMAGNPMRQDDRPIRLDERWKDQLPRSSRILAQVLTAFNRKRYGYR